MDRDSFLDTLRGQYADEIQAAFAECEHDNGHDIDYEHLNEMLNALRKAAVHEGLSPGDFEDLVDSTLPQAKGHVTWNELKKAA